jgi:hypothetical protein
MIQHDNFDAVIKSGSFAALSKDMILEILAAKPPYSPPNGSNMSTSQ